MNAMIGHNLESNASKKLTLKNGTVYDGYFKSGKFDGQGKLDFLNRNKYKGSFKGGYFDGYG